MKKRFPFDWRTPLGYVAYALIQLAQLIAASKMYPSGITITVGACMQIANFASDIKEKFRQFNRILISLDKGTGISVDDEEFLRKKLNEINEFYSEARE